MNLLTRILIPAVLPLEALFAGTVVITSVPDGRHPLAPLTSPGGIPLAAGVELRVGAFPGMTDDQILNAAATGGLAQLTASFVPFGAPFAIGDGVDGAAGSFEIAVKQNSGTPQALWVGEEVSLIIRTQAGGEFMVARFDGKTFAADPDTGLDPLLSLHLADAKIVVGNRYGTSNFATSSAPAAGTFDTWISSFTSIIDPAKRLPGADADGDGRSNFLEYVTAGNPASPDDQAPCQIQQDGEGGFWVRFSRSAGLGSIRYSVETSGDLVTAWQSFGGTVEPDPNPPVSGSPNWMRVRVPAPLGSKGFFRLNATSVP
jgi:hypothetical protein